MRNSEIEGWYEGLVTALSVDRQAGRFRHLELQPSLGATTAHNAISHDGRHLFAVNLCDGRRWPGSEALVAFERRTDGSLAPGKISVAQSGTGPNPRRQERSHPHSVTGIAPNLILVADLGTDQLTIYALEEHRFEKVSETPARPGAGPRHGALHPSGRFVFVINELDSTVASYRFDAARRTRMRSRPTRHSRRRRPARITHRTCRYLRTGGFSTALIAGMTVSRSSRSTPKPAGFRRRAKCPAAAVRRAPGNRPAGGHLLCASQDSDVVTIFTRDRETGALGDSGKTIRIGTPMCLRFAKA